MSILRKRVKTNSKIKKQQQTLTTSKKLSVLKTKLNNRDKIASDKTETEENNLYFTLKDLGPVHNKAW